MPGGHIVAVGWALLAGSELPRIPLLETVWKLLYTDYTSHHQSCHRRVDKGLPGGAQPLEVFGHPPVVRDPREGSLYDPSTRQDSEAARRHEPLPIHLLAFLGPLPCPSLGHLLRERLPRLAHHLHTQSHNLLGPTSPPSLVSSVDPQVSKAREEIAARRIQQHPNAICVRDSGAVHLGFKHQTLGVYQEMALSSFHLLGRVEPSLVASHASGSDRLGVHYRRAGVGVPAEPRPQTLAQLCVQALPGAVDAPPPKPVVDGLPRRELARQQPPGATALQDVEDSVEDRP